MVSGMMKEGSNVLLCMSICQIRVFKIICLGFKRLFDPFSTRLKIAQDASQGLAYLHEETEFQIIIRDFKSSNILLDENWNAKLSDFRLARLGPSDELRHVLTAS